MDSDEAQIAQSNGNGGEDGPPKQTKMPARKKPEAFARGAIDEPEGEPKPPFYKRPVPLIIGGILIVGITIGVLLWWLHARQYESTDDAFIAADVTHIAPQVAGRVQQVLVNDNDEVKAGQLLVEIRPKDFEVRLEQAKASEAEARARVAQAQAQEQVAKATAQQGTAEVAAAQSDALNAQDNLKRYESLSRQAVSAQQLDAARNAARTTAAQLQAAQRKQAASEAQANAAATEVQAAQAAVRTAQASLEQAQTQLSYTKVYARRDGWVTNKAVAIGDYVQIGQQLLAIVPNDVWVTANFKENQLTHMRPGQPATISVDAFPDEDLHGTVQSVQRGSGAAFSLLPPENATGNYVKTVQRVPVKITFDQPPKHHLGPGMSVEPKVKVR